MRFQELCETVLATKVCITFFALESIIIIVVDEVDEVVVEVVVDDEEEVIGLQQA